jgi:hypothetical protein
MRGVREWVQDVDKFILNKHEHNILNFQSLPIVRQAAHFLLVTHTYLERLRPLPVHALAGIDEARSSEPPRDSLDVRPTDPPLRPGGFP